MAVSGLVTSSRVKKTGTGAVNAANLFVSTIDTRTIEQAIIDAAASGGGGGGGIIVDFIPITAVEEANGYYDLSEIPGDPNHVAVLVVGGSPQTLGTDFTIISDGSDQRRLNWVGLGLEDEIYDGANLVAFFSTTAAGSFTASRQKRKVDFVTVDATIESQEYYDLIGIPADVSQITVNLVGGSIQYVGDDYNVVSDGSFDRRIEWPFGTGLNSLIVIGSQLVIEYTIDAGALAIPATEITLDTGSFSDILGPSDVNVQLALETLDTHTHPASIVILDTINFDGKLSALDDDPQKAFETLDDHEHSATETVLNLATLNKNLASVATPNLQAMAEVIDDFPLLFKAPLLLSSAGGEPSPAQPATGPLSVVQSGLSHRVMTFAQGVDSFVEWGLMFPFDYDGGPLLARFSWFTPASTLTGVVWSIRGLCYSNGDSMAGTYGTPETVTDTNQGAYIENISDLTGNIVISGTPAPNKYLHVKVGRIGTSGSDTTLDDVHLKLVSIEYGRA